MFRIQKVKIRNLKLNSVATIFQITLLALILSVISTQAQLDPRYEVAEYVRDNVLDGEYGNRTIWISSQPVDSSYLVRPLDNEEPVMKVPYEGWMVMIDDAPRANWGHYVRWLIVQVDLGAHTTPQRYVFPPRGIFDDAGNKIPVTCLEGATSVQCESPDDKLPVLKSLGIYQSSTNHDEFGEEIKSFDIYPSLINQEDNCLYAILISGGINVGNNHERYRTNLRSMYTILLSQGYPKNNIFVYYADGASLDLDNADGDNDDSTGSDVNDSADESTIRTKLQELCDTLHPVEDYLFVYVSDHGSGDGSICLWDFDDDGLDADEKYSPAEMDVDTEDCQVCRLFMLHDQCFSGAFLPLATDGNHDNTTVYAAATASESSWGREYLDWWENLDHEYTTLEDLHQDVVDNGTLTSTPGKSEVAETNDQVLLGDCCVNIPPIADANGPYVKECEGAQTILELDGTASIDPDPADTLNYGWTTDCPGGTFDDTTSTTPMLTVDTSAGCSVTCNVFLTVTDQSGASDTNSSTVTIQDTMIPVIACPADLTIECDESSEPSDTGMATATDDCDSNPTINYTDVVNPGSCPNEETTIRTWTATDYCGNTSSCVQTINVVDTTPPVIQNVTASPNTLWPPNHKMIQVNVSATAVDDCDPSPDCIISSVNSNEPPNGVGDGNTAPDWVITGNLSAYLRAERSGTGDGRIYTIAVSCTDGCGNSSVETTSVTVQHNQ